MNTTNQPKKPNLIKLKTNQSDQSGRIRHTHQTNQTDPYTVIDVLIKVSIN